MKMEKFDLPEEAISGEIVCDESLDEVMGLPGVPALHSPLESLFSGYNKTRDDIERVAGYIHGECSAFTYFAEGARQNGRTPLGLGDLFDREGALRALDTDYWNRALRLTDVLDYMPAKRRNEWSEMIRTGFVEKEEWVETRFGPEKKKVKERIPAFEAESVKSTLQTMLASRQRFFAERVDGLWNALSDTHLTNQPQAFGKRMILKRVIGYYGYADHDMVAYIHDLRVVIARFMGRDAPHHTLTNQALSSIAHDVMKGSGSGKWHSFDGGAWKVRCYKVGTAHMEIHPDLAWRLNAILASLHPMAIPSEFRKKPAKARKEVALVHDLVPFEVLDELRAGRLSPNGRELSFYSLSKPMSDRCASLLQYLGGVRERPGAWVFDYDVGGVNGEILRTGQLPEQKAFQYYPTPANLAEEAVRLAGIGDTDRVLEPSAGQGGIADFLPKERTVCVELSRLHAKVLEAKGFKTVCEDFLDWVPGERWERIVMNPPFADGRAEAHLLKAASLLTPNGVLVAILPSGFKGKEIVEGRKHEWSAPYHGEFKGASVSVVMLKLS